MGLATSVGGESRDAAIIRGSVAVVVVRVISTVLSVITLGIAAQALTKEEFGLVAALFSLWMVLTMFDLGVGGALVTRVASAHARLDLYEMRAHTRDALVALTAIGGLIAAAGTVCAFLMPWESWVGGGALPAATVLPSVVLVFVLSGVALPAATGIMTLTGQQRLATAQLAMAMRGLISLAATAAAAYAGLGPGAFLLALVGAPTLVSLAITAWVLFRELGTARGSGGRAHRGIARTIGDSLYLSICNIANGVAFGTGTVIVASVTGPGDAAVFGVASRMFTLVSSTVLASGRQLWPAMTNAITRGDIAWARSRYRRSMALVGLVTAAACLSLVMLGQPIARIWVGSALVPPVSLLVWTAGLTVVMAVASQVSVVLLALDRLRALALLSVANAVLGVTLSVILTREVGMSGAAAGAVIACLGIFLPGVAVVARRTLRGLGDT